MASIALFDLDYTLLDFDSDHAWGEFLCDLGKVDAAEYRAKNDRFYADYRAGVLDMPAFIAFSLAPLGRLPAPELLELRERFMRERGLARIRAKARQLVQLHRGGGDRLAIVTATNDFVTRPFADALGVETLLATQVRWADGRPTGQAQGQPCFREGKIAHVQAWLDGFGGRLGDCVFYSDSHNDLPLLGVVGRAVAVDPDATLMAEARVRQWDVMSLKG
jgi:HAD superfamily hydrolase (TIGR01490 family)